jgi:lipid II:glycine glycyltransferase (peptidoglycan interpeptide bridge formation enzyme)
MPEIPLIEWQTFVHTHLGMHLLQTGEWGELKAAFGWKAVRIINGEVGAQVLFRKLPLGFTLGYIPKPSFINQSLIDNKPFWSEVDLICTKHRAIFCKLEPDRWENENRKLMTETWSLSRYNIQPPRTIVVDIQDSEEAIMARMKQKCRYNIRLAEKKGVTVRPWDDLYTFYKMLQLTGGRDGFGVHSVEYYQRAYQLFYPIGKCELLVAEFEGKALAALMVFACGYRAWYVYGASTDEERNRMPTYLLQWEAMRWAKARGCREYDLWGVPDEDESQLEANFENRHDGLWGVYRFKRGFGGELKRATQALDRVYYPWLYELYLKRMAGEESL